MFLVCSGVRVLMRATGVARGPGARRAVAAASTGAQRAEVCARRERRRAREGQGGWGRRGEQGAAAARGHERAHRHAHARAGDENTGDERGTPQSMALGRADRHPVNRGLFFPLVLAGWTMKWVSSTMATTRR